MEMHIQLTRRSDGAVLFEGQGGHCAFELETMGETIGLLLGQGQGHEQEPA